MAKSVWVISVVLASYSWGSDKTALQKAVSAGPVRIEYRAEDTQSNQLFEWHRPDYSKHALAAEPFMTTSDFGKAVMSAGPNGELEITYTKAGARKFQKWADEDRNRSFCLLIDGVIYQCSALPPESKELYLKGTGALTLDKTKSKALWARLRQR